MSQAPRGEGPLPEMPPNVLFAERQAGFQGPLHPRTAHLSPCRGFIAPSKAQPTGQSPLRCGNTQSCLLLTTRSGQSFGIKSITDHLLLSPALCIAYL